MGSVELLDLVKAFVALFVVIDPIGNIPIFIGLTSGLSLDRRRRLFDRTGVAALFLLVVFVFLGEYILSLFAISIESFMVAGGVLLLAISIKILAGGGWGEAEAKPQVGLVPLACPLLVGPGAITTSLMLLRTEGLLVTLAAVLANVGSVWVILRFIDPIYRLLGETGSDIVSSVTAIIVAAIAVEFIFRGVRSLIGVGGLASHRGG